MPITGGERGLERMLRRREMGFNMNLRTPPRRKE
jgi:hypothetical protein